MSALRQLWGYMWASNIIKMCLHNHINSKLIIYRVLARMLLQLILLHSVIQQSPLNLLCAYWTICVIQQSHLFLS